MTVNIDASPGIWAILERYRPTRHPGRRAVHVDEPSDFRRELIENVALELENAQVVDGLDGAEFATLASAAASARRRFGDDAGAGEVLRGLVTGRRSDVAMEVAYAAIAGHGRHRAILDLAPELVGSHAMIEALIEGASLKTVSGFERVIDVDLMVIGDIGLARRALAASVERADDFLPTFMVAATARGLGWTPWSKLFAILFDNPELGDADAPVLPPERRYEGEEAAKVRMSTWAAVLPDFHVRRVARLLLDLDDVLSSSGPDVRSVFVERLRQAIGGDADLRRAAVEGLLWRAPNHQRDLALFAASRLVEPDDEGFVGQLASHPDRRVGYAADMVRHAAFGTGVADGGWPTPGVSAIAGGLFQLELMSSTRDAPLTWIGDRLLERLIEQTVAGEERRFADEYVDHSEEGEEGLLRSFLSDLAQRFRSLDQGLRATAMATGARRVASVDLTYRPVDKAEEGKPGVNRDGDDAPPAFSADLCLIVDPYLDGKPLGKRATLVQAKRLRLKDTARPERGLASSFKLDPAQMTDLTRQTASSYYLFQCPGLLGRGIPIVPTKLVEDLARHHAPTAAQIPADLVGPASRSLADWLTYVVLALRTGDPLAELVAKAEGGPSRRPRPLCRFGTIEVAIRVGEPKPRDG